MLLRTIKIIRLWFLKRDEEKIQKEKMGIDN